MTYWLVEAGAVPMFTLDKDTGEVTLVAPLDYENRTEYRLGIEARHGRDVRRLFDPIQQSCLFKPRAKIHKFVLLNTGDRSAPPPLHFTPPSLHARPPTLSKR